GPLRAVLRRAQGALAGRSRPVPPSTLNPQPSTTRSAVLRRAQGALAGRSRPVPPSTLNPQPSTTRSAQPSTTRSARLLLAQPVRRGRARARGHARDVARGADLHVG